MTVPDACRRAALSAVLVSSLGTAAAAPFFAPFGIDTAAFDSSTRAQDDFYQYVNGGWLKHTTIPDAETSVTLAGEASNRVTQRLHELLEAAATLQGEATSTEAKVGAMYAAFMDKSRVDALGVGPIQADIQAIQALQDKTALAAFMGRSQYDFGGALFALGIDVDLGSPERYTVYVGQAGLGLPDRDYYLRPEFSSELLAYRTYIERLLTLVGWSDPPIAASAIVTLETQIAEASWPRSAQRDLRRLYNPMSPAQLVSSGPGFRLESLSFRRKARGQEPARDSRVFGVSKARSHLRQDAARYAQSLGGIHGR